MSSVLEDLYKIIEERKNCPQDNSYTCYLFQKGVDKILKKVGEEASEVIISSKNGDNNETVLEICDLAYHVMVLMANQGISLEEVIEELEKRREKIGNKKPEKIIDKNN